jgi:hypothetical protein
MSKRSGCWIWVIVGLVVCAVVVAVVVIAVILGLREGRRREPTEHGPYTPPPVELFDASALAPEAEAQRPVAWSGGSPLLGDVNGDGQADAIGRVTREGPELGAFDVMTGELLWSTRTLPEGFGTLALAEETVLLADELGTLNAFSRANGTRSWTAPMGERAQGFCKGRPGHVVVRTADRRNLEVALATGQLAPLGNVDPCLPVWSSEGIFGHVEGLRRFDHTHHVEFPEVDGVEIEQVLQREGGAVAVGIGQKRPGTPVPMAVGFTPSTKRVLWTTPVPGSDPLATGSFRPEEGVTLSGDRLIAIYIRTGAEQGGRLVCRDLAEGSLIWEVPLRPLEETPQTDSSVVASDRHVFVADFDGIQVFDLATGAFQRRIGGG